MEGRFLFSRTAALLASLSFSWGRGERRGIDFITIANNHQFDYGFDGLAATQKTLTDTGIAYGGVGASAADVRRPVVLPARPGANPVPVAFFMLVVDECWVRAWPRRWPRPELRP